MEEIALQLFKLGDQEQKGFIIKRDMQRFQSEVSLPPDQLEAVFESLDTSHNGYLTLDQFLAGVSNLDGEKKVDHRSVSEPDLSIERLLKLNVLHKSGELMCEMRGLVGGEDTWHQLTTALFSDLNQLLRQISQLEETLRAREHHHQEELQRLYEEFENQLADEREKHQKQLNQREAFLKIELGAKDQQITELLVQRDQLQERLQNTLDSYSQITTNSNKCQKVVQEKEVESHKYDQSQHKNFLQVEKSYAEGFSHAHKLAILHEEGLVKQLRLLQEMQENLRSDPKPEKHRTVNYDDF